MKIKLYAIYIVVLIYIISLSACDMELNVTEPCDPLPVVDGFKTIITLEGDITLKLPHYITVMRDRGEDRGCEYARSLWVDYLWYKGKLIPEYLYRFKVPKEERVVVKLMSQGFGYLSDRKHRRRSAANPRPWRFDDAIPHKRFPLEYYPKLYWDNENKPSDSALTRARLDSYWGISNAKYKHPSNNSFMTYCNIPLYDKSNPSSRVNNDVGKTGSTSCRGHLTVAQNKKYINILLDVQAGSITNQKGLMEINLIYDAAFEKIQSFMQE